MLNAKEYVQKYVTLGKPVPYKDLLFYPFIVDDYYEFEQSEFILRIEKNKVKIDDIEQKLEIIKMNYLTFIVTKLCLDGNVNSDGIRNGDIWKYRLLWLLSKSMNIDIENFDIGLLNGKSVIKAKDKIITADEFNDIRKIILFQNKYDYDDAEMSDDFKRVVSEYYAVKNKGYVPLDMDNKISAVMAKSNRSQEDINKMTLYRFESMFNKIRENEDYLINKNAESNGCTFKKPIEHWLFKKEKSRYADVFSSVEGLTR